jgi:hypothetical protein
VARDLFDAVQWILLQEEEGQNPSLQRV